MLIFEHGSLYNMAGELPDDARRRRHRRAAVRRAGADVTLIAYGGTLRDRAGTPPRSCAGDGIEAEVIDLRALRPLDDATIMASRGADPPRRDRRRGLAQRGASPPRSARGSWSRPSTSSTRRSRACAPPRCRCRTPSTRAGRAAAGEHRGRGAADGGRRVAEFRMPSLGADMTSGTLLEWRVKPGDEVNRGDIVAVVDTEQGRRSKSRSSRRRDRRAARRPEGDACPVGTRAGAARVRRRRGHARTRSRAARRRRPAAGTTHCGAPVRRDAPAPPTPRSQPPHQARGRASPLARRGARPASSASTSARVAAAGPAGRSPRADVERASAHGRRPAPPAERPGCRARTPAMRHAIGALMAPIQARDTPLLPADGHRHEPRRSRGSEEQTSGARRRAPPAVGAAAEGRCPRRGRDAGAERLLGRRCVARRGRPPRRGRSRCAAAGWSRRQCTTPTAVTLDELMAGLRDLVPRARAGRLRGSEMSDPTITVTNLGEQGVEPVLRRDLPAAGGARRLRRRCASDRGPRTG